MSSLTSILVHVDETKYCPVRLALAAGLARHHDAALVAAYAEPSLLLPAYMPGEVSPALFEIIEAQRQSARAKAEAYFAALQRDLPSAVWHLLQADERDISADGVALLASEARLADLAVVGQAGPGEDGQSSPGLLPEQLVLQTGRPVLVIPYAGQFPTLGERALVAWTDSRESARALADALPLLRRAKTVTLLQVCKTGAGDAEQARRRMAGVVDYLKRRRISAAMDVMPAADSATVGEVLLSRAADLNADLLVMGAYGHSRWRELVLGGATREILGSMTLPVLLSH